jgi:hypothetical protein
MRLVLEVQSSGIADEHHFRLTACSDGDRREAAARSVLQSDRAVNLWVPVGQQFLTRLLRPTQAILFAAVELGRWLAFGPSLLAPV